MNYIIYACSSLSSLPDISKWNINKILIWMICFMDIHYYHHYLEFQNRILIILNIWVIYFLYAHHYHLYLLFKNIILIILLIWILYFLHVHHYYLYLAYQIRILIMLLICIVLFYKCSSLLSLPGISKWNANNVFNLINVNISSLFT